MDAKTLKFMNTDDQINMHLLAFKFKLNKRAAARSTR